VHPTFFSLYLCVFQLYHKLCSTMASVGFLQVLDRGLAVQLLAEHDPSLLSLPFLALAPRSFDHATDALRGILGDLLPPLACADDRPNNLVKVDPPSLVRYLKDYDSKREWTSFAKII
jgi:hypothetical protein